jgi:hypothetical protein
MNDLLALAPITDEELTRAFCDPALLSASNFHELEQRFYEPICSKILDGGDGTLPALGRVYNAWAASLHTLPDAKSKVSETELYVRNFPRNARGRITPETIDPVLPYDRGGIDLPLWFRSPRAGNIPFRVMVVGQDPQRNTADLTKDPKYNVTIGSPYALHSRRMRETKTKGYWNIFEELLRAGMDLYITDLYKVYAPAEDGRGTSSMKDYFTNLLWSECRLFGPDVILTFGRTAYSALCPLERDQLFVPSVERALFKSELQSILVPRFGEVPVFPLIHPSGNAVPQCQKMLNANGFGADVNIVGALAVKALRTYKELLIGHPKPVEKDDVDRKAV